MTNGMAAFMAAVSGTSLIAYLLMGRIKTQDRNARRQSAGGDGPSSSYDSGTGGEGWNPFSWFSTGDSSDGSDTSGDSGGDGGGGDGGGGGD